MLVERTKDATDYAPSAPGRATGAYQQVPASQYYVSVDDANYPPVYPSYGAGYQYAPNYYQPVSAPQPEMYYQPMTELEIDEHAARNGDIQLLSYRPRTQTDNQSLFSLALQCNQVLFANHLLLAVIWAGPYSLKLEFDQFFPLLLANMNADLNTRAQVLSILKNCCNVREKMHALLNQFESAQSNRSVRTLYVFAIKTILDTNQALNINTQEKADAVRIACTILNDLIDFERDHLPPPLEFVDTKFMAVWQQLTKPQQEALVDKMLNDQDARIREGLARNPEVAYLLDILFSYASNFGWSEQDMFVDPEVKAEHSRSAKLIPRLSTAFCSMFSLRHAGTSSPVLAYSGDALKASVVTSISVLIALAASEALLAGAILGLSVYATSALIATIIDSQNPQPQNLLPAQY